MKQANPGTANYEFLNILQMCLDAKLKAEEDTEKSRKEVQELSPELVVLFHFDSDLVYPRHFLLLHSLTFSKTLKSKLRKSACIKSISSKTQDSRIQIEKWEAPSEKFPNGKAKKVYLHL